MPNFIGRGGRLRPGSHVVAPGRLRRSWKNPVYRLQINETDGRSTEEKLSADLRGQQRPTNH